MVNVIYKQKQRENKMKTITKKQLENILISLIKKIDSLASNIVVEQRPNNRNVIKVDYIDKNFPETNLKNVAWVVFGKNDDGNLFFDVDGMHGGHFFGEQDYSYDMQIAWSYIQQQLAKFNAHSESFHGYDGIYEEIFDGTNLNEKDLEENVFEREPSKQVQLAIQEKFKKDFPEFYDFEKEAK